MTVVRNTGGSSRSCRNPETGSFTGVDVGETIDLPAQQAENMVEDHGWSYARDVNEPDHAGWAEADEAADAEPAQEEADAESGTTYEDWLEDRTNDDVADDVEQFDDLDHLHGLLEAADRTGAQDAIQDRIDELED